VGEGNEKNSTRERKEECSTFGNIVLLVRATAVDSAG